MLILGWAYLSALKILPSALKKRWKIQRTKKLSNKEVMDTISPVPD